MDGKVEVVRAYPKSPASDSVTTELSTMPTASRISFFSAKQRTRGNRYMQRVVVQAKLEMEQSRDVYEQEADRMADAVMRMPEPGSIRLAEVIIQTKQSPGLGQEVALDLEARINHMSGKGLPLPEPVRAFFEQRFGYDFSQVRIHMDAQAVELARALNARAFTVGQDVVFGAGQYALGTTEGMRLLAHELTHVIQQTGRGIAPSERPRYLQCANNRLMSHRFADDPLLQSVFRGERLIQRWDKGPAVKKIQQALIDAGFSLPRYGADSDFGSETEAAVRSYQSAHGLEANGIIVTTTMESLDALFSAPPTTTPEISARDVIDERIDVHAQYALQRMFKGDPSARADATQMLTAVKAGQLKGIYKEDQRVPAMLAKRWNTEWWQLIPEGEDAALIFEPVDPMIAPPIIVFRDQVRSIPYRIDPALRKAWASYSLMKMCKPTMPPYTTPPILPISHITPHITPHILLPLIYYFLYPSPKPKLAFWQNIRIEKDLKPESNWDIKKKKNFYFQ